jgi:hypothetical protein
MDLSGDFTQLCLDASAIARREAGRNFATFNRMLAEHGGVETARRLIAMNGQSAGFVALHEAERLDLTAEALAILPRFSSLFTEAERHGADAALRDARFPVDRYLEAASRISPPWQKSPL